MAKRTAEQQNHGSAPTATGQRKGSRRGGKENPFVQLELVEKQHKALKQKLADDPSWPAAFLVTLVEANYRVSVRWDDYTNSPAAWVFPPEDHETDAGMIMAGRGGSAWTAMAEAFYKIYLLNGQPWPRPSLPSETPAWDDLE